MFDEYDFAEALDRLFAGRRMTCVGWDPTEYVVAQRGYPEGIPVNANTAACTGLPEGTMCRFSPYLMKRDIAGVFAPWTPTQADLFRKNWREHVYADGRA
jgi:hypothetical protein